MLFGESEARGVMVAWHGHQGVGHGEPGADMAHGALGAGGQGERLDGWGWVESSRMGQTARAW
jgi:hypothetical protein